MSYLDSGFNENLIREEKSNNIDIVNVNEILDAGAIPVKEFTNALTSVKIINSSNNLIKDVINDKLDTEAKIIKGSFNFGTSGALQIGNYEAGVSGDLKISPNGIVARNSSDDITFAIDGTTGDATFRGDITGASGTFSGDLEANSIKIGTNGWHVDSSGNMWWGSSTTYSGATIKISKAGIVNFTSGIFSGTLNAPSGTLGTITGGTITGADIQTASSGLRTILSSNNLKFYDGTTLKGLLRPDSNKSMLLGTASSFYIGDLSGNYNVEITSGGSIHILESGQNLRFYNGTSYSQFYAYTDTNGIGCSSDLFVAKDLIVADDIGCVGDITAGGEIGCVGNITTTKKVYTDDGISAGGDIFTTDDIYNGGDIQCGGTFRSSDGSGGDTKTMDNIVTWITSGKFYYHKFTFKDGLVTDIGSEQEETF